MEGQTCMGQACMNNVGKWGQAQDLKLLANIDKLQVLWYIVVTIFRPDMVYSED